VLASILDQLVRQATVLPRSLVTLYTDPTQDLKTRRSWAFLQEPIKELVSSFAHVYLFIDALDEFPDSELQDLMKMLSTIHSYNAPSFHLLTTSQSQSHVISVSLKNALDLEFKLNLEALIEGDIYAHIHQSLRSSDLFQARWLKQKPYVIEHIEDKLKKESDRS
jgi:hypothetical protein